MTRLRHHLPTILLGLLAFAAACALAWAISRAVRDDAVDPATDRASRTSSPPLAEELSPDADRAALPGGNDTGAADDALALRAPTPSRLAGRGAGGSISPALAAQLRTLPLGPVEDLDGDGAASVIPTSDASASTRPSTTAETGGGPAESGDDTDRGARGAPARLATRFVDPCADRPSVCEALAGRPAVAGTVRLTSDEPDPVRFPEWGGLDVSSGTSEGCSARPVLDGRRAIGVMLNRPASLRVSWTRMGGPVGSVETFELTDADRERYDARRRTWRTCLDVSFPTDDRNASALATVTATADDGTTDTESVWAYDDDRRRLVIALTDRDDELVALTPAVGDTTIGAVALRDDEDQVEGCRRVVEQLLSERPRPPAAGEDTQEVGIRGARVPDDLAAGLVPSGGGWRAARFTGLRESQRYGVCLYAVTSDRGERRVTATDAVFVQAPDREQYQVRPLELIGPGSIDGDSIDVRLDSGVRDAPSGRWSLTARTSANPEQDLPETSWFELGDLPAPELYTAAVTFDGHTSEAVVPFPARCADTTSCDPVGAARLVRLDIPGRDYTRRLCGTGDGACGGLRRRSEVIGSVILLIERTEGRRGFEGWSIGESRRFDAALPEPYWVKVDNSRSGLVLGSDHAVRAAVRTDVASTLRIVLVEDSGSTQIVEQTAPATDHTVVFPEPLDAGECAYAEFTVSDPTGARVDESSGLRSVCRPAIRADVTVQFTVLAWPHGVPDGTGGELFFGVNGTPADPPPVTPRALTFECAPADALLPPLPTPVVGARLGSVNRVRVRVTFQPAWPCGASPRRRIATVDATVSVPWSDLADGTATFDWQRPEWVDDDGLRLRVTVTATNVLAP